ncbi:Nitrite reductase [NAD(P)H] [Neomoorella glycerini]|uniref:Nitrite reductase [NAD(P)H] n=1 Tax=Neomoorella glycerini TaxID=55779 RepID=A0A6I5ZRT5_9FIRM|nr:nitrite reductase [Moorella glycerini]QGP92389.1 Nitrite reductase [NAD(P)H] [Moorella glycerini]
MGDAIFKQRSGYLGVGIVARCGILTPAQLAGLGDLARALDCQYCKLTTRQTLIFIIPEDRLEDLRASVTALGLQVGVFGEIVRNIKACAGNKDLCQRSLSDVFELGGVLQDRFMNRPTPCDFKIALAGCHRGCTDPQCADYGIIATGNDTYDVYLGGRGGSRKPIHATRIATGITGKGVENLLAWILERYDSLAEPRERLCNTIARVGLEPFLPPEDFLARYRPPQENDFLAFAGF